MLSTFFIGISLLFYVFPCRVSPEEIEVQLPEAQVESKFEEQDFVGPLFTETNTKIKMTEKGINALGPTSKMSAHKAISLMPSVNQQSVDPSGLSDISNYHESFRFRGVEPTAGGNPATPVNVENIPITGRPGGGITVYDMENFESISIYKGGCPADSAFGLTNIGGKIDLEIKKPKENFSVNLKQTLGSESFRRSFIRLDTGRLPTETAGFLSYSNTGMDKWKGKGNVARNNAMLGLNQQIGDRLNLEAHALYNKADINTYRSLDYEKASALGRYHHFDYTNDKTDDYYYGYNKSDFEDYSFLARIEYTVNNNSKLLAKPFYWKDDGYYLETITMKNGSNRIRKWEIDHELCGLLTQYSLRVKEADINVGYFHLEQERPGPPNAWKLYRVTPTGLDFDKWQILSNASEHQQKMPFVSGKYTAGPVTIEGGIKYLDYTMPAITTYDTKDIPDVSYDKALGLVTAIEANASAKKKDFTEVLPHIGLSYVLSDTMSTYFSYGRNYGMSVALYPYFISQKSLFYQKGISLQDLWNEQELEIADNFDIGIRYITETLYIVPTLYYAKHRHKLAVYYDTALGVSFPATKAEAEAYGLELEAGALLSDRLSLYASFSYNKFYYSKDIHNSTGSIISIEGDQVPDAPEFLLNGILSYQIGHITFSPIVRYSSKRYGDILHREKIDEATIFDVNITYTKEFSESFIRTIDFSLMANNIFDKEYISIINTSDYKTLGSSYQIGSPFTLYASVSVHM